MVLAQVEQGHIFLSQEQKYCGHFVINSAKYYILTSYPLSRPRSHDFRFVIYSYMAENGITSIFYDYLLSCLYFFHHSVLSNSRQTFAYGL